MSQIHSQEQREKECLLVPLSWLCSELHSSGPSPPTVLSTLGWVFLHQLTMKTAALKHATGQPVLDNPSTEVLLSDDFK